MKSEPVAQNVSRLRAAGDSQDRTRLPQSESMRIYDVDMGSKVFSIV
jgi:hypothetical protein